MDNNELIRLSVVDDFSVTAGGRFRRYGKFSGEEFFESVLSPKYREARRANKKLLVDFDGGYGYSTGFLYESFKRLVEENKGENIANFIVIKSKEQPQIVGFIQKTISLTKQKQAQKEKVPNAKNIN